MPSTYDRYVYLGREFVILERNWSGRGFIVQGGYTCFDDEIQEFAIDEDHGLLLALTAHGLFVARTLDGDELVWSLSGVVQFAQSGDSLLLWRGENTMGTIQVWRFADSRSPVTVTPIVHPSQLAATEQQLQEFEASSQTHASIHGGYIAHANLPIPPGGWRTFAIFEPYLALVDRDHQHVIHIYDILRGELHQVIDLDPILIEQSADYGDHCVLPSVLLDLQLSAKYLCACFDFAVIVARLRVAGDAEKENSVPGAVKSGVNKNAVLYEDTVHSYEVRGTLPHPERVPVWKSTISRIDDVEIARHDNTSVAISAGADSLEEYRVVERTRAEIEEVHLLRANTGLTAIQEGHSNVRCNVHCYISAKFSPNGRHLVIGTTCSHIYFFPDIDRMFDAGIAPAEIVQKMVVDEPIRFIKWDAQDRVFAFQDEDNSTWLLNLCPTYHAHRDDEPEPPLSLVGARVLRVHTFGSMHIRAHQNLQVRKAGVWAIADLGEVHRLVCAVKVREDGDLCDVRGLDGKRAGAWEFDAPHKTVCMLCFTNGGFS
ncbi:hypothetical protein BC835DRAFT_115660 [Cytidiella melzeri]|nr:hypothetical protein BC835DRAFT_115660 [Cytidiella melzeri]